LILFVHFLLVQKTNQKRTAEIITSACTYARYTGYVGATVQPEVRAISALPTRRDLLSVSTLDLLFDFKRPQKILGKSECF